MSKNEFTSKEFTHYFIEKIAQNNFEIFQKTAPVLVREVPDNYINTCSFGDFIESSRPKIECEVLCRNMNGLQETWFSDREKLYVKTEIDGQVTIDGEVWDIRRPNQHKLNLIGAFQYNGELGDTVSFIKPLYNNEMSIKTGSWLAFNLENPTDIWAIEKNAMQELYTQKQNDNKKLKP